MILPEIDAVEHLALRPWETLIVHVAGRLGPSQVDMIRRQVTSVLPRGAQVLVVDESIRFEVVTPSESE